MKQIDNLLKVIGQRCKVSQIFDYISLMIADSKDINIISSAKGKVAKFGIDVDELDNCIKAMVKDLGPVQSYDIISNNFILDSIEKGVFYTPKSVSDLCMRITYKPGVKSVYDPTCGAGSMLNSFGHIKGLSVFGQDCDELSVEVCRGLVSNFSNDVDIRCGDTLEDPKHKNSRFDAIVSNPPYSIKWSPKIDDRFAPYGTLAPADKADMAFIQHNLFHLDDNGTCAIVVPHGVLFRSGAEGKIRKHIIKEMNALDAVIGLPANLFYGTGIPAAVLVFKKCRKDGDHVLFIDASDYFEKGKNQNTLRTEDVDRIIDCLSKREVVDKYSALVSIADIEANDFNLNIPRYVDKFEEADEIDIQATQAEIVAVNAEIADIERQMQGYLKELGYA